MVMYSINFNFLKLTFQYKLIQSSVDFSLSSFNLTLSFWTLPYFFFSVLFSPPSINYCCYFILLLYLHEFRSRDKHTCSNNNFNICTTLYLSPEFFHLPLSHTEFLAVPRIVMSHHSSQIFEVLVLKAK